MTQKVIETIKRCRMLSPGAAVIAAVSGGADSMALVSLLNSIKDSAGFTLCAAHVDHGIRGETAERDRLFVESQCKKLGIALHVLCADVPAHAKETGLGLEECGRKIRYEFFASINPDALIATAHTQTDNIETVLFNLTRGSGLKGLCGIPPVRGNIIRPLIDCSRAEVEQYCAENGIEYITDETNFEREFSRNKIRLDAVPVLREINPGLENAFLRCTQALTLDEQLLSSLAEELLAETRLSGGWSVSGLKKSHPALMRRAAARIIESETGIAPEEKHIAALCSVIVGGGAVQVCSGASFVSQRGLLRKISPCKPVAAREVTFTNGVFSGEELKIEKKQTFSELSTQKIHKDILANQLDYDKIEGNLSLRGILPGDVFRQNGRGVTKKLRRIFSEKGIPADCRGAVALLADSGGVIWVDGIGVCERCAVTELTKTFLIITKEDG